MSVAVAVPIRSVAPSRAAGVGVVRRNALLDRMETSQVPVVSVVAPAGYGKTTLLAQLAEHGSSPVAWLTANDAHNDPVVLCKDIATALDVVESATSGVCPNIPADGNAARLGALLAARDRGDDGSGHVGDRSAGGAVQS